MAQNYILQDDGISYWPVDYLYWTESFMPDVHVTYRVEIWEADLQLNKVIEFEVRLNKIIDIEVEANELETAEQDSILVSGAGSDAVNGVYKYVYMDTGKPAYRKGDYYIAWFEAYTSWWAIYTSDGEFYISSDDVATPDLVTTWEVASEGVEPVPTATAIEGKHQIVSFTVTLFKTIEITVEVNKIIDMTEYDELKEA